jgi:DNA-directed RNA polymerase II subunit RPB2
MAYNFVYTFKSKDEKNPWVSEIRSVPKGVSSLPAIFKVGIKIDNKGVPRIFCKMKYVNKEVPIGILFRALGIESDVDIIKCICYDLNSPMLEILRSSLELVDIFSEKNALRFIGTLIRKPEDSNDPDSLIRSARHNLEKVLLPHVGMDK